MKTAAIIAAVSIAAAAGALLGQDHIRQLLDPTDGALAACEADLRDNLKSPSSYKRLSTTSKVYPVGISIDNLNAYLKKRDEYSNNQRLLDVDPMLRERHIKAESIGDNIAEEYASKSNEEELESFYKKTYRKITSSERDAYKAAKKDRELKESLAWFNETFDNTKQASIRIVYEADNAYGASMKDTYLCNFGPPERGKILRGKV